MDTRARVGVGVIVLHEGKLLMVQRRGSHGDGTWSVPGGHIEFGESLEQCAAREVLEETGVTVTGMRFHGLTNDVMLGDGKHYVTVWIRADYVSGEARNTAPDESAAVAWVDATRLPEPRFVCLENLLAGRGYEGSERGFGVGA
jgi:8-oxo-dGTP diphosphatase